MFIDICDNIISLSCVYLQSSIRAVRIDTEIDYSILLNAFHYIFSVLPY